MKQTTLFILLIAAGAAWFFGFHRHPSAVPAPARLDAHALILAANEGSEPIDGQIAALQERIRHAHDPRLVEQLGWLFVSKARIANDPGFYKLAEQCALVNEAAEPDRPDALLLRGHAFESMHRFRDAEAIARRLVARRSFVLDHALLGDSLMEQGRVGEAIAAYQQMVDLKPCLQAYARIAHVRWLTGDLDGAIEMAELAVRAGNARDPEALAWAITKLAVYRTEKGDLASADAALERAFLLVPDYTPAFLQRGRLLLAQDRAEEALPSLREAARRNPLPDYEWTLIEALHAAHQDAEAAVMETALLAHGAAQDPRTFSLFLSTRGERADEAVRLAEEELSVRRDVFTYDALAWACHAAGRMAEAQSHYRKALAEGTGDARMHFHAGMIAAAATDGDALRLLRAADSRRQMLLPSERAALAQTLALLTAPGAQISQK